MKKSILVTGGAGFIGSHLVGRLIGMGYKVVVVDDLSTGKKENINKKSKFYKVDILSQKIKEIFRKEKPEIVYHLAAKINVRESVKKPIENAKTNILGSLNILENCQKFKVKKIIFASTGGAIYGETKIIPTPETYPENPLSPYGIEKFAIEKYLNYYHKVFGLPYVSLRLANVYGPRQNSKGEAGVIAIFIDKMLRGKQPIIYGTGKQKRDFVFVDDVAEAFLLAMKSEKSGIYNIGTGKETSINEIFDKIKEILSAEGKKVYQKAKLGDLKRSCLNISKAKKELKWQPKYNLEKGLKETISWFSNH